MMPEPTPHGLTNPCVRRARRWQQGFTLLELLVAFAIMAMALALIYRGMGSSARQAGDMAQRQEAMMLAQSLLTQRDSVPVQGWQDTGTHNRFNWEITSQVQTRLKPDLPALHEVAIRITWQDAGRQRQQDLRVMLPEHAPLPGGRQP